MHNFVYRRLFTVIYTMNSGKEYYEKVLQKIECEHGLALELAINEANRIKWLHIEGLPTAINTDCIESITIKDGWIRKFRIPIPADLEGDKVTKNELLMLGFSQEDCLEELEI